MYDGSPSDFPLPCDSMATVNHSTHVTYLTVPMLVSADLSGASHESTRGRAWCTAPDSGDDNRVSGLGVHLAVLSVIFSALLWSLPRRQRAMLCQWQPHTCGVLRLWVVLGGLEGGCAVRFVKGTGDGHAADHLRTRFSEHVPITPQHPASQEPHHSSHQGYMKGQGFSI